MIKSGMLFFVCSLFLQTLFGQQAVLMLPIGHTSWLNSAQFSPDGKKVVTASDDRTAKIWDVETGALLADLKGHAEKVKSAGFSPDGKKILTASESGATKIWDALAGNLLTDFKAIDITSAEFSPDGKKVVTSSLDGTVKIWNAATGTLLTNITAYSLWAKSAGFSPDGKRIVTTSDDQAAKVWDAGTGKFLFYIDDVTTAQFSPDSKKIITTSGSGNGPSKIWNAATGKLLATLNAAAFSIFSAQFSPDGKKALTTSDYQATIWDAQTGKPLANLKGHSYYVTAGQFSPDGKEVVTASKDGKAKIWDTQTGKLLVDLNGHTSWVSSAQFSGDGKKIVTASIDETAKIWDTHTGKLLADLKGHTYDANSAQFTPDGKKIFMASINGSAKTWDAQTGRMLPDLSNLISGIKSAQLSPDGKKIVTIAANIVANYHTAKMLDSETGKLLYELAGHGGIVNSAQFSSDSKKIVTASNDSTAKIWDATTGKLLVDLKGHTAGVVSAQFSADGKKLVTGSDDTTAKIWDAETGKALADLKGHDWYIHTAQFSPDAKKVATTSLHQVKVWDAETGKLLADLKGHTILVNTLQFSPDGKKIVTASNDSTAKLWDTSTGALLADLKGHTGSVNSASFSPDGKKVITASNDYTAKTWDAETGKLITGLKGHSGEVISAIFSPDGKHILTNSLNNTEKTWDASSGRLLYTFFAVDSADYLVTDPYGRYDGTEAARKLLYFTCGTEVIGLDQVKDQLWVPNLAERIMKGDSINAKKLSDLDICGLVPEVEKEEKTGYHFNITPRRGGLGETVLLVNDIEVKRYQPNQLAKTAIGYELNVIEQELQTYFIAGKLNPVTVKAYTAKNDIASRGVQVMQDETKKQAAAPNLYAVMIGVSDYKGTELQLKYAAKDATDISAAVAASAGKLLGKGHVFTYNLTTSANHYQLPEKIAIKNVFGEIGKKATSNDILLVFFAGHGVTSGEKKQFYFLTADASQASATDAPDQVGISTKELSEWMQPTNIKAQKRILILDACNSGQAINEIVKIGNADQNYLAARNDDKSEQIKAIDKLNEKSGLFILAASASNQSAYEMGRYSQGLLTYSLLKAIKQQPDILEDGKYLNVSRWFNAAEKTVSDVVRETGNRQEPQIVSAGNFNIGVVDQEVMAGIKLADEKPLFTACKFFNGAVDDDDLDVSSLIDQNMNEISARGSDSQISYVTASNSPDAWSLSGRYEVKGDAIAIKVNVKQNKEIKHQLELTGKKSDLKALAERVVNEATDWILKKK